MSFTRDDIRASVERAGDAHWRALVDHHEDAYPASRPTPGDVCRAEADRLNSMGLGSVAEFDLVESRVERIGDAEVRLIHVFRYKPLNLLQFGGSNRRPMGKRTGRHDRERRLVWSWLDGNHRLVFKNKESR